ncbi:MAG TPA: lipid-A-disaccharide synthase [Cyclobacteriaceae bacterium]|nr:lipid-A-disaccharide synthase [Cyclobacteriaceae bacterium]
MKYYIVAGERSGDLHGGNLTRSLKELDPGASVRGWGGEYMESAGAVLVKHYRDLAFMGFMEVLINFRKILANLDFCRRDILRFSPDVIILIDFAGFNFRIASFARKQGIRVFYYISPKIWAWYTSRVYKIKSSVERMFVILPFEVDFYRRFDVQVDYVGNPVAEAVRKHKTDPEFTGSIRESGFKKVAALLPGSRYQEVYQAIPLMMEIAEKHKEVLFLVAAVNNLPQSLYASCLHKSNVRVVPEKAYDILSVSQAAIVTSGTATLETALWKVPQVVIYKANLWISALIARMVIKVRYISLVNLICDREVVKELIQENLTTVNLLEEFNRIQNDEKRREEMLNGYREAEEKLGYDIASEKAAKLMVTYLRN